MFKYKLFLYSYIITAVTFLFGQNIPSKPDGYVNEFNVNVLTSEQKRDLTGLCKYLDQKGVAQVVVAIFDTYGESTPEDFTIKLAEQWKIGHKGKDNGLIIAVFMKERKIRLEVGYGLEGNITDAQSWRIINKIITPYFKKQMYYNGLKAGIQEIAKILTGAYIGNYKPVAISSKKKNPIPITFIILLLILFNILFNRRSRSYGSRRTYWGGGFGGFGGGSGGGFSGGGGSFGGGGATGGW